jgi:hypothetical protein
VECGRIKIVESSAKPNGNEIGMRGTDQTGRLTFLGFFFVVSGEALLTSDKCRDGALKTDKKGALKTLYGRGQDEICPVCFWEDDGQDNHDADEVRGGPNGTLSLTEARTNFRNFGACETRVLNMVRRPLQDEQE